MKSNSRLRVAIYDPSGSGGICHYTFQLAESLALAGVDVTVFTTDDYELRHLARAFKTYALFRKSWIRGFMQWAKALVGRNSSEEGQVRPHDSAVSEHAPRKLSLLQLLRIRIIGIKALWLFLLSRPDVIHIQWLANLRQEAHLIRVLKLFGFKIVYTAHDLLPQANPSPRDRVAYQKMYRLADQVIVHAENNKRELMQLFDIRADKISVLQHGSYDLFHGPQSLSKDTARQELGIPQTKRVVLFFGLIKRYKGLEYLVQAFEQVQRTVKDASLLIVGKVYEGVSEDSRFYANLLAQLSGRPEVICVEEYVPCERIAVYFSASDVVVLPYTKSYQSGVLLSAYAAGRAVIVTDTGGLSEAVKEDKSGLVIPPRDVDALAQALTRLLGNPNQLEEMGRYAKYLADTTYSWNRIASKTIDCYNSLLTESEDAPRGKVAKSFVAK